jgi:hypothetical protein
VTENQDKIDQLVRRYREIGSVIEELRAEQSEIKAMVNDMVDIGWKSNVDGQPVHKRLPNRSFCAVTATGLLTAEQRKNCVVTRYDEKMLRAAVDSLGKLEECMLLKADSEAVLKL